MASTAKSTKKTRDTYLCHTSVFKICIFTDQLLSIFIKSDALRFIQDHFLVV